MLYSAEGEISKSASSEQAKKSLDYFDPMVELKNQPKGEDFYKLYLNVEKEPREIIQRLSSDDYVVGNNPYYAFIKYRVLYLAHIASGERTKAYQVMKALEQYAEEYSVGWLKGDSLMWQSTFLLEKMQNEQALELLEQAVALAESSNYQHLKARSINIQAIIYSNTDNKVAGVNAYLKAIKIFEKLDDYNYLSKVYNNLSIIYMHLKQWPQAGEFLIKSLNIYKKSKQTSAYSYASTYINLAILKDHLHLAKITKYVDEDMSKLDLLRIAAEYADKSGSERLKVNVMVNRASALVTEGMFEEAKELSELCINKAMEHQFLLHEGSCYGTYGQALVGLKDGEKGLLYLKKSFDIYKSMNSDFDMMNTHNALAKEYVRQENFKEAYTHQKQYIKLQLRQMDTKRNDKIIALQAKFDYKQQQQEIELLNLKNSLQQSKLTQKKIYEILWICLALLLMVVAAVVLLRYVGLEKRFTQVMGKNKKLYRDSYHDQLTNLYNRRFLDETLNSFIGNQSFYALIVLDIDHFKSVNDNYGHDYGDQALKEIAKTLKHSLREGDLVFRFGGEEFVLLMATEELEVAKVFSERLRQVIADTPIIYQGQSVNLTASFGIANIVAADKLSKNWSEYFKQADMALYSAKDQGRNQVMIYKDIAS